MADSTLAACFPESIVPRDGVVTLYGYGISVTVRCGHLILKDGIGPVRREAHFSRIGHGLRRLIVVGSDGNISLAALRWLTDQKAAFVMLDRNGSNLAISCPVYPSDARLRRAQGLADTNDTGLRIVRELISQKLLGQEKVARYKLCNIRVAESIAEIRKRIGSTYTKQEFLSLEAHAASAYWSAWKNLPVDFPKTSLPRVPNHWRTFGPRISSLSGSPRLAVNPGNAILNYLYALLESEASLAITALGLDPGLGFLHLDNPRRDNLACDVMEPVRPIVDAYLLDWINRGKLRREWFFEQGNGNCRLMSALTTQLSETITSWRNAVGPYAEGISKMLWAERPRKNRPRLSPTPLTQRHRRIAKGNSSIEDIDYPKITLRCKTCGASISKGSKYCVSCAVAISRINLLEASKAGRIATITPKAQALRSTTQRQQAAALKAWSPSAKPDWLDETVYREKIQPQLAGSTLQAIMCVLKISRPYAANIRAGKCIPHPRHWLPLASFAGMVEPTLVDGLPAMRTAADPHI
jgi:CRISPR-associated endonuclease Cas1